MHCRPSLSLARDNQTTLSGEFGHMLPMHMLLDRGRGNADRSDAHQGFLASQLIFRWRFTGFPSLNDRGASPKVEKAHFAA